LQASTVISGPIPSPEITRIFLLIYILLQFPPS